ncbi:MAG: hypothetical protein ACP5RC_09525, partial [Halothiobacillaceae bacterium]
MAYRQARSATARRTAQCELAEIAEPLARQFGRNLASRYGLGANTDDLIQNIWILMTTEIPQAYEPKRPILPFVVAYARNQALGISSSQVYANGGTSRVRRPAHDRQGFGPFGEVGPRREEGELDRLAESTATFGAEEFEMGMIDDIDRRRAGEQLSTRFDMAEDAVMVRESARKPEVRVMDRDRGP